MTTWECIFFDFSPPAFGSLTVTLAAFPLGTGAMLSLFAGMGTAVRVAASRSGLVDLVL